MSFGWNVDSEEALQEILRQSGSDVTIKADGPAPAPAPSEADQAAEAAFAEWTSDASSAGTEAAPARAKPGRKPKPKQPGAPARPDRMTEHEHQAELFRRLAAVVDDYPEADLLFAIPNGAKLPYSRGADGQRFSRQGAILKQEGLKAGVPDMFLPVPRTFRRAGARPVAWHGLFVELKREKGGRLQDSQREWHYFLRRQGYACAVAYGHQQAYEIIIAYLEGRLGPAEMPAE